MENLDSKIQAIIERNKRVEADKAWETSLTRRGFIAVLTYAAACLFLWLIKDLSYYLNAFVPTAAYLLSTFSIPHLKKWWIRKHQNT